MLSRLGMLYASKRKKGSIHLNKKKCKHVNDIRIQHFLWHFKWLSATQLNILKTVTSPNSDYLKNSRYIVILFRTSQFESCKTRLLLLLAWNLPGSSCWPQTLFQPTSACVTIAILLLLFQWWGYRGRKKRIHVCFSTVSSLGWSGTLYSRKNDLESVWDALAFISTSAMLPHPVWRIKPRASYRVLSTNWAIFSVSVQWILTNTLWFI